MNFCYIKVNLLQQQKPEGEIILNNLNLNNNNQQKKGHSLVSHVQPSLWFDMLGRVNHANPNCGSCSGAK